jgi:hypothetical protein
MVVIVDFLVMNREGHLTGPFRYALHHVPRKGDAVTLYGKDFGRSEVRFVDWQIGPDQKAQTAVVELQPYNLFAPRTST